MKNQKILYIVPEVFPTFRPDVVHLFGKYLPRLGLDSDVVALAKADSTAEISWDGGRHFYLKSRDGSLAKNLSMLWLVLTTFLRARLTRYQAVQVRDMPFIAIFGLVYARVRGIHFYYWCSHPFPDGQIQRAREKGSRSFLDKLTSYPLLIRGWLGKWILYQFIMKQADHVFVQSEQMLSSLQFLGIDSVKMTPVPMAVDFDDFNPDAINAVRLEEFGDCPVLAYLGTMDPKREIHTLLDVLVRIHVSYPDARLLLVGDTADIQYKKWFKSRISEYGLDHHVRWTGWLPGKEARALVAGADIAYSPFPRGWILDMASPTKISEYFALRVLVVANDNPDQKELIRHSKSGECVPYDPDSFAEATLKLLNESSEDRQRQKESGYDYVKKHRNYQNTSQSLFEIYKKILPECLRQSGQTSGH